VIWTAATPRFSLGCCRKTRRFSDYLADSAKERITLLHTGTKVSIDPCGVTCTPSQSVFDEGLPVLSNAVECFEQGGLIGCGDVPHEHGIKSPGFVSILA